MKQFIKFAAAAAVFASSTLASAAVITLPLSQTTQPATPFLVTTTASFNYTFDLPALRMATSPAAIRSGRHG
jgi:hypothetical protein